MKRHNAAGAIAGVIERAKHPLVKVAGILALVALAILASGCAGAVPGNPQGYSGINHGEFSYDPDTGALEGEVWGGKENEDVALKVQAPDGTTIDYSASGTKAFDGQAVRGAVEEAVSADVKDSVPGIVDTITDAILQLQTGG